MIIAILGPTGVGKTKMSIALAKKYRAEIINCDAMQVYREMNIGTAKVTEAEKEGMVHHLFDIAEVKEDYNVYRYQKDCRKKIEDISEQGKNIILVGGTGLYLKAALYDYRFSLEEEKNEYTDLSEEELLERIKVLDPSPTIDLQNRRRLVRHLQKLENGSITETTGNQVLYPSSIIALTLPRERLYQKIDERVEKMMREGLLEEAKELYDKYQNGTKALDTAIGYKELFSYFRGEVTFEQAVFLIKKNSRHYAKRQYTFFRNQFDLTWFEVNEEDFSKTIENVESFLERKEL